MQQNSLIRGSLKFKITTRQVILMSSNEFNYFTRITGTDLSGEWYAGYALTRVRGVGARMSQLILKIAKIPLNVRIGFLSDDEVKSIENIIKNPVKYNIPSYMVNRQHDPVSGEDRHINSQDLPIYLKADLDRMKKIRSYKGIRHELGLRVRGQHTRTTGRGGRAVGVQRRKGP